MDLDTTQDAIIDYLNDIVAAKVEEHAIPDSTTVPRSPDGKVVPYVAVQFGDVIQTGNRSFDGPLYDDYTLPVYLQVVTSTPRESRRLANFLSGKFLGQDFPYSGSVRKRLGGAQFPMEGTNVGVEAFVNPLSFGVLVQLANA